MRERGHGRTTNGPVCIGWMQFQIIFNYYYLSKAVSYLPYIHIQVHGAHDGKSKSFIEVYISFKLIIISMAKQRFLSNIVDEASRCAEHV